MRWDLLNLYTKPTRIMKVIITSTPEFSAQLAKSVVEVLRQTPGEIEFSLGKQASVNKYGHYNPKMKDIAKIKSLSFKELFNLCDTYRTVFEEIVPADAYVVLLTTIKNKKDWFSAFNERNIFIHGEEWEYYTKRDSKYGIAYQVLENIFQSLIDLNINDSDNEPNIHKPSIGCINDMCMDKVDVMLKLRTAYICDSCLDRAEEKQVNPFVLEHIKNSVESIRETFVTSGRIRSKVKPLPVSIDSKRNVKIGGQPIHIFALERTLFIFFLKNLQGVKTGLISEHENELYDLYKEIRKSGHKDTIIGLFHPFRGAPRFISVKSKLNKDLSKKLGAKLADNYIIDTIIIRDRLNLYKINLEQDFISIAPHDTI